MSRASPGEKLNIFEQLVYPCGIEAVPKFRLVEETRGVVSDTEPNNTTTTNPLAQWTDAISGSLKNLGEMLGVDRIGITEIPNFSGTVLGNYIYQNC
jgi:hypothetical protein